MNRSTGTNIGGITGAAVRLIIMLFFISFLFTAAATAAGSSMGETIHDKSRTATPYDPLLPELYYYSSASQGDGGDERDDNDSNIMAKIAGYGEDKLSTVLVTGSLVCQQQRPCELSTVDDQLCDVPISGAIVGVTCHANSIKDPKKSRWAARGATDGYGEFTIDLPSHLHAIPDLENACSVRTLQIPKTSRCRLRHWHSRKARHHSKTEPNLKVASVGNGIRTYTAGTIMLLPPVHRRNRIMVRKN